MGRYGIKNIFLFTAERFFPCLIGPTVMTYIFNVVAQGREAAVEQMLNPGPFHFGQQTGVIHLKLNNTSVSQEEYFWQERHTKPCGQQLPVQCSQCGSVYAWSKPKQYGRGESFKCNGRPLGGKPCNDLWIVLPDSAAVPVKTLSGEWQMIDLGNE